MKFNPSVRNAATTLITAAGVLSATAASAAPTAIQLEQSLLDRFNLDYVQDEEVFLSNAAALRVDLSTMMFAEGAESLDVYFVNESAGYRSQLTFSGGAYENETIFRDIASSESLFSEFDGPLGLGNGWSYTEGLSAGDAVRFDLFSNGRLEYLFGTNTNVDGLQHVVGYEYTDDSGEDWLILGLEDLYGELGATGIDPATGLMNEESDRDFNDVVIAVKGLSARPESVPEPGMMLGLGAVAAVGALRRRKSAQ